MGGHAELTVAAGNRVQAAEEQRAALQRVALVGCFVWPPWVGIDIVGAIQWHNTPWIPGIVTLRAVGTLALLVGYASLRWGRLTPAAMTAVDVAVCTLLASFIALIGVEHGGFASSDFAGVMLIIAARTLIVPARWSRSLVTVGPAAVAWPGVVLAEASLRPEVRATWAAHGSGDFVYGLAFIVGALALCTMGSHTTWRERRQMTHAQRLGDYRLKMRIGSGGNGDVWVARQEALKRDVALKVLKDTGSLGDEKIRRFEREARAAASLTHPNTIRIFEFGASDDGVLFIAMELLEGLDVEALVEVAGPLPPARAVKLVRQACASLAEAHVAGIVHRDIKPGNLFVTHAGGEYDFVKLLDFGVARISEGDAPSLTETGILFGTPAYMPPEVCSGERASTRSDIYSLGAVLYFMLTGTALFPDRTFAETVMSHISKTPETPSARLGKVLPEKLDLVVMKCLEKKREARFRSVRELDEALASIPDLGEWSREDAHLWWTGARNSLAMKVRGAA
ncbi:MAG TPA: serine/threonine-protein kinase [Polyangiaceae bacterium]